MGRHSKHASDVLASMTLADATIPGLAWRVTVTPDSDTTDGLSMYENHGTDWQWANVVVTPLVNGIAYAGAAHGATMAFGTLKSARGWMNADLESYVSGGRFYTYDDATRKAVSDSYESVLPIVPVLISQANEALPAELTAQSHANAIVVAKLNDDEHDRRWAEYCTESDDAEREVRDHVWTPALGMAGDGRVHCRHCTYGPDDHVRVVSDEDADAAAERQAGCYDER